VIGSRGLWPLPLVKPLVGSQCEELLGGDGNLGGRTYLKGVDPWGLLSCLWPSSLLLPGLREVSSFA
jgi:hypothetical protein